MPDVPRRGQDLILEISAAGSSFTTVGLLRSKSLTRALSTIETSNDDSPEWATSITGQRSWGISGGALYVYDDAGQVLIEAAYAANTAYTFRIKRRDGATGSIQWTGTGFVTQADLQASTNEVIQYSLSVTGTGPLVATAITGGA
jgi:predicted secreted protein